MKMDIYAYYHNDFKGQTLHLANKDKRLSYRRETALQGAL